MKINGRESAVSVATDINIDDCYRWSELRWSLRNYFTEAERRTVTKIVKTLERGQSYKIKALTITVI